MTKEITDTKEVFTHDLLDAVCFCHAGLAQDSPNDERHYLNCVLNILFAYLTLDERKEIEDYLAEKKYLPPVQIII